MTAATIMFAAYAVLLVATVALLALLRRWPDDGADSPGARNDRRRLVDEGRVS